MAHAYTSISSIQSANLHDQAVAPAVPATTMTVTLGMAARGKEILALDTG